MAEVPLPTPTQVPVPSTDIRNAVFAGAKLDEEVTGTGEFYTDRLGVKRLTNTGRTTQFNVSQNERSEIFNRQLAEQEGIFESSQTDKENRFQQFLLSSGYVFLGDYENGPFQFSARNQYIRYDNQYYRLNAATDVGFTTTGTDATSFVNDVTHFVLMDGDTLRQNLGSSKEGLGDALVSVKQPGSYSVPRSQHSKNAELPSIYDWATDSVNDDTLRFKKAISDGYQHILLPQGNLFVSELEITAAINLVGYGGIGLNGVGTSIIVNNDAAYGIHFNGQAAVNRPTGGSLRNIQIGCADRATMGSPDLLKFTSWSHFNNDNITLVNTKGWGIRLKDFMESYFDKYVIRAVGGESSGGILIDDYLISQLNNVNNVKFLNGTFAGLSGPWFKSTVQSNADVIWIENTKAEFDAILSSPNETSKNVIDFLQMANSWVINNRFAYLNDTNNMYENVLHMGAACSFATLFYHNHMFGVKSPWNIEGGNFYARDNFSNQASYSSSSSIGGSISSNKACYADKPVHVTSNGNTVRMPDIDEPRFVSAHKLPGSVRNDFIANSSASKSTVLNVPANTQIRSLQLPSHLLDGTSVVNIYARVSCVTSGTNGVISLIVGSTTISTMSIAAGSGWQLVKFTLTPSQIAAGNITLMNSGSVAILFDGILFGRTDYIDWEFGFAPGTIAAGAKITSTVQGASVAGLVKAFSQAMFNSAVTDLIVSVNTYGTGTNFTVTVYNPSSTAITTSATRCTVRLFLN